jgi:dipeptidyl aminopeptidase/acylaminoacyl peptidase
MAAHVSRLVSLSCGLLLAGLAGGSPAAQEAAQFGPESLFGWQFVGDPRISPDGKRIAYVRATVARDRDEYDYDLWIDDGSGPRALTTGVADDRAPRWSPDGSKLAFASNRSGKRQVHVLDMSAGGEPWQLTADTDGVQSFKWSYDGKRIAFTSQTTLSGDPGFEDSVIVASDAAIKARAPFVTERMHYRNDGTPGYRAVKRTHIWVVETDQGAKRAARRITNGDFDDGDPAWSPDGRMIYFSAQRRPDEDYTNDDTEVYVVPSDGSAEPRALTQRAGPNDDPLPSPDGRWIAFTGYDETSPPQSAYLTRLYVMRPDGSQVRQLAVDFDRNVPDAMAADVALPRVNGNHMAWGPEGASLLFTSCDRGQAHLYEVKVSSGDFAPLTRFRQGDVREFTVSRNGRVAAAFNSSASPAEIYAFPLAAAGRGEWQQISKHTAGLAPAGGFSPYEEIWYDSFDGQRIQGWIVKPPGFAAERKYPFILYIHGGPHAMYGSGFFHEFQTLAQAGYVVLITNPRGSTGYGEKFANIIQYKYPGDDFRDLMTGVDEVVKRGYVDEKRMGVAGGSGGGLLTSWTVGQTDRFAAAVVERAVTNWYSFVGSSDLNYLFVTHWFRDFPWRDSADYLERSPLSHVDQVKTPVLVIHSEQDYRTAIDQGLQYYAALKMLRKPAKIAVFPESSHGLSRDGRPSQRVQRLKIISAWFDQHLKK